MLYFSIPSKPLFKHCLAKDSLARYLGMDGKTNEGFGPLWSTIPDVAESCEELISKVFSVCKCVRNGHRCKQLCACGGHCSEND